MLFKKWTNAFTISLSCSPWKPWMNASGFMVIWLTDQVWQFLSKEQTCCSLKKRFVRAASRCSPEENQNSLWRRVIFNKPAEVRGDQSMLKVNKTIDYPGRNVAETHRPRSPMGKMEWEVRDWRRSRAQQQVGRPTEHHPYPFSIYWQLQTILRAPSNQPSANIPGSCQLE